MAEQQRESEELLHNGVAAFERGEIEAARQMLNAAVQRGGAHDVALAFLTRIDRIHAATPSLPVPMAPPSRLPFRPRTVTSARSGSRWASAAFVILLDRHRGCRHRLVGSAACLDSGLEHGRAGQALRPCAWCRSR